MSHAGGARALDMILFDLDGTLADTARDLWAALERLCEEEQRPAPAYELFRPVVSQGSPAMLQLGFDCEPTHPDYPRLRARLLDLYHQDIASHTTLFPDIEHLIATLERGGYRWGIVTNKPGWLTEPLLEQLGFGSNAACVVSGDTLPQRKPDPEPLLYACRQAACPPARCAYVGDARTDITAGRRAGMHTVAASFGYIPSGEDPRTWQADTVIDAPLELLDWMHSLPNHTPT